MVERDPPAVELAAPAAEAVLGAERVDLRFLEPVRIVELVLGEPEQVADRRPETAGRIARDRVRRRAGGPVTGRAVLDVTPAAPGGSSYDVAASPSGSRIASRIASAKDIPAAAAHRSPAAQNPEFAYDQSPWQTSGSGSATSERSPAVCESQRRVSSSSAPHAETSDAVNHFDIDATRNGVSTCSRHPPRARRSRRQTTPQRPRARPSATARRARSHRALPAESRFPCGFPLPYPATQARLARRFGAAGGTSGDE